MTDYEALFRALRDTPLEPWLASLPGELERVWRARPHGDLGRWLGVLRDLPMLPRARTILNGSRVGTAPGQGLGPESTERLRALLLGLHPWRKGPYEIHGIHIDAEWRSDWKWDRLAGQVSPLTGRRVLDVGCGNGYHCWRMAGAGAGLVVGIDPGQLFVLQFYAVRHFLDPGLTPVPLTVQGEDPDAPGAPTRDQRRARPPVPVFVLPLALEDLPLGLEGFDTVFSMGVLYHRRSPEDHLRRLRGCLRSGGELVLETLVVEDTRAEVLVPEGRYARMRNVWLVPSLDRVLGWLGAVGFENARCVDVTATTPREQRSTPWMRFESLAQALDPADPSRTLEGLPAPRRAIFIAGTGSRP